jgi:3-hydroxyisobutyrate dehydrogenase-like beta-hydroxyacid dehydrogenase
MSQGGEPVGWLGAGRMGAAMAGRLLGAGVPVRLWNRTRGKLAPLVERGAVAVDELNDLSACDVVFMMVSSSDDLRAVTTGDGGLLSGAARPKVLVDCSTVSADASAAVRSAAAELGVDVLASPVSGNRTWSPRATPASSSPARGRRSTGCSPTCTRSPAPRPTPAKTSRAGWSSCATTSTWA